MTKTELLLIQLAEECAETAKEVSKALRFTLSDKEPGQDLTNGEKIMQEFNDIYAIMKLLCEEGALEYTVDVNKIKEKKEKVLKWLEYSKKMGTLSDF